MKKAIAIVLLLVGAGIGAGQEVKLPEKVQALPGAWVVVAPVSLDGGPPRWEWDAGLTEIDLSALFGPELAGKARGKVFTATTPGTYEVRAWNAKGDSASPISRCTLTIIGTPAKPMPDPPKDPPSTPLAKLYFLIVRPDGPAHPELVRILSLPAWASLDAAGHQWRDATLSEARAAGVKIEAGQTLPVVVVLRSRAGDLPMEQVRLLPMPTTTDAILKLPESAR